jgi:bacillithiol biosynthesis cysteine-adding enzyme BshC
MSTECYPITILPSISRLYRDYLAMRERDSDAPVRRWYGFGQDDSPFTGGWMRGDTPKVNAAALADELLAQNKGFGASEAALANIEKLRSGAHAVVTGQQVALLGGPLLILLKAATAVSRAREATRVTGIEHVPVFWMATEDHDLAEVDLVSLLDKESVASLRADLRVPHAIPVGKVIPGVEIDPVLERASELLAWAPIVETLRECYRPSSGEPATLALAFGKLIAKVFAAQGLVVIDASSRACHALGATTLRVAIEYAAELQRALIERSNELTSAGYHAQVTVAETGSLLFLLDEHTGERVALRRSPGENGDTTWKAGPNIYTAGDLLAILDHTPERLSPNALLRPVFQDTILPTAVYIGGPAEIAYFAQSAVVYERILGRITPVLPRLSATLIEPAIATVMEKDEIQLPDAMTSADELAQRLGARAMPIALKKRLSAVGNTLDDELNALTQYLTAIDPNLAAAAETSASKMLYQMNRLRRMAATSELQKESSLRKHATAITLNLFPDGHPQERVLAGVWFLARYGDDLIERLVTVANNQCPGHVVVRL